MKAVYIGTDSLALRPQSYVTRVIGILRGKSDTCIQPVRKIIIRSFKEER